MQGLRKQKAVKLRRYQGLRNRTTIIAILAAIVVFGGLGTALLTATHAATLASSVEAEDGVTDATTKIADSTASGGQAIKFGNGTTSVPGSFPDATNTGVPANTTLTNSGSITANTPGQVISGLNITGCVDIEASNVTLKNSRITETSCDVGVVHTAWSGISDVTISNVEIVGNAAGGECNPGLTGSDFTADAINLHGTGDGSDVNTNVTIENSYLWGMSDCSGAHIDGVQTSGGTNVILEHNTIYNPNSDTSAVMIGADLGAIDTFTVDNNLLAGGGYTLYGGSGGSYNLSNIEVTNNKFSTKFFPNVGGYGAAAYCLSGGTNVWSGNTYYETGKSLSC